MSKMRWCEMKIYVTRHGQTARNAVNRVCGGARDLPITDMGREQAKSLAGKLSGAEIDLIISSPMIRAAETAQIISRQISSPVIYSRRLKERDYGRYEGESRENPEYKRAKREFSNPLGSGESLLAVAARVYPFLDEIIEKYRDKTLLLVCHGGITRVINSYFTPLTDRDFHNFNMENCGLAEYEI